MRQMKIGSWIIEVDVNKTKEFYDNYHVITEDCNCDYCANYFLACEQFPPKMKELFRSLGIDPRKEGEVTEYIKNKDGTHLYSAFYHLVGRIIEGGNDFVYGDGVEISFTEELDLVPVGFPKPTIQFEIQMEISWVLK